MDTADLLWTSVAIREAVARDDAGTVIRLARRAADLNQTALGRRCGYSASTISRIERGQPPAHDIDVRRRIAQALGIPPQYLGLTPTHAEQTATPPRVVSPPPTALGVKVGWTPTGQRGDPVQRRELLTGLSAAAAASTWPWSSPAHAAPNAAAPARLEELLTASSTHAAPTSPASLAQALSAAQAAFTQCQYNDLAAQLARLIAAATASRNSTAGQQREQVTAVLATAYGLASELCVKLNDDALGWVLADRALAHATHTGQPIRIAHASRSVAVAMRRAGHHTGAISLLTTTAQELQPHHQPSDSFLTAYGTLLCTAAYSSAQHSNRGQAVELIDEATDAATRLTAPFTTGEVAFSPTNVAIYKIGIFTALGESATALHHASTIDPRLLPTPERHARFCIDTARAWAQHGRPDRAYQALHAAEHHAPPELRRPSVRDLISTLLYAPAATPSGLRDLAVRVGAIH